MTATLVISIILAYFLLLISISFIKGGKDDGNDAFFLGNKQSPWYVVAFGMIGASLSGVTFISVPGWVNASAFSYMQVVLGYVLGYAVIIKVLLPLYYKLELTSIYTYLEQRFGFFSYKTGAFFFLISRIIGAAFRLYLVAVVLQYAVFDAFGIPFWLTVVVTIALIWVYTFRSGIKTIIWTDTLQTAFMLAAVMITVILIKQQIAPEVGLIEYIRNSSKSQIFFWDSSDGSKFFVTQFLSGAFITIVMTGLDQDMMQKNLSCRTLKDAQKNMFWLSLILIVINLIFLSLGVLLYDYAAVLGISEVGDKLYPAIALSGELGLVVAIFFVVGLVAAAYSSADSALTALTTSFCVDFLSISKMTHEKGKRIRKQVHLLFSLILLSVILVFRYTVNESVIKEVFVAAGYTYGPLLGMYAFGLFSKWNIKDKYVPYIAVVAPILCYIIKDNSQAWFGYTFGFELLILNGLLTFTGLYCIKRKNPELV